MEIITNQVKTRRPHQKAEIFRSGLEGDRDRLVKKMKISLKIHAKRKSMSRGKRFSMEFVNLPEN